MVTSRLNIGARTCAVAQISALSVTLTPRNRENQWGGGICGIASTRRWAICQSQCRSAVSLAVFFGAIAARPVDHRDVRSGPGSRPHLPSWMHDEPSRGQSCGTCSSRTLHSPGSMPTSSERFAAFDKRQRSLDDHARPMAIIQNPAMALTITRSQVKADVTYDLRFSQAEQRSGLFFHETVHLLGARYPLKSSRDIALTPEVLHRQWTLIFDRALFESGVAFALVQCRIVISVSPPIGGEAFTNSAVVPGRLVDPYVPITWVRRMAAAAVLVVGGVVALALAPRR